MKQLLKRLLCSEDPEVLATTVERWQNFYTLEEAIWDIVSLYDKIEGGYITNLKAAGRKYPLQLYCQFDREIAGAWILMGPDLREELRFFAKNFMTRGFTKEELRTPPYDAYTETHKITRNIDIINSVFP